MSIISRGKGKWEIRVYGYYQRGKPKSWIVRGSKKEAEKFEATKKLEALDQSSGEYRTAPSFLEFSSVRYKAHAKRHLKGKTFSNRVYQIATLIEHFGRKQLSRITVRDVERFKEQRIAEVGPAKVNDDLKVLRVILRYAVECGVPAKVPRIKMLPVPQGERRVRVWTAGEVQRLYQALDHEAPQLLPIVTTMLNTGLRKGEALALEWGQVDTERGFLKIYPSEDWQPKNGRPREVPFGESALPYLTRANGTRWVFPSSKGTRYAAWPQRQFDAARKAAGLEGGPHTCRHTFASHFLATRPDMFLLAQVMGHSHARVTELYSHLLPDHLERARGAVELAHEPHDGSQEVLH